MVLLLLAACASRPDDTGAPGAAVEEEVPAARLTAEEAVARVGVGTQHGLPDPVALFATYLELMARGDEACPGPGEQLIDSVVPLTGCTSSTGLRYAGVSMIETEAELAPGSEGLDALLFGGDFTIDDEAGRRMDYGGQVFWMAQETGGGGHAVNAQALGTFEYPGGSPWLAAGVSAVVDMELERDRVGATTLLVDGGVGTEGVDLWFDALTFAPAACDAGPASGGVRVRDPAGPWWTLDFGDRCDGCGTLSYPGAADAEACVDLLPLFDATAAMLEVAP